MRLKIMVAYSVTPCGFVARDQCYRWVFSLVLHRTWGSSFISNDGTNVPNYTALPRKDYKSHIHPRENLRVCTKFRILVGKPMKKLL